MDPNEETHEEMVGGKSAKKQQKAKKTKKESAKTTTGSRGSRGSTGSNAKKAAKKVKKMKGGASEQAVEEPPQVSEPQVTEEQVLDGGAAAKKKQTKKKATGSTGKKATSSTGKKATGSTGKKTTGSTGKKATGSRGSRGSVGSRGSQKGGKKQGAISSQQVIYRAIMEMLGLKKQPFSIATFSKKFRDSAKKTVGDDKNVSKINEETIKLIKAHVSKNGVAKVTEELDKLYQDMLKRKREKAAAKKNGNRGSRGSSRGSRK